MAACPCGGGKYQKCCGRYHGGQWPPTPETLMRSRYSAFALGNADYLLTTWHSATRPEALDLTDNPRWIRLVIEHASQRGTAGEVIFSAYFIEAKTIEAKTIESNPNATTKPASALRVDAKAQTPQVMREHSLFRRVAQRWYYLGAASNHASD